MRKIISCFLLLCLIVAFCSCNVSVANFKFYADAEKYSVGNVSYEAELIKKIEVNWVDGKIEILKSEDGTFSANENSDNLDSEERMHYYLNGGTLIIQYCESGYNSDFVFGGEKNLTLVIPEGIDIDIDNVSADIVFSSDITLEDVDISNVSGNIDIKKLTADSFDFENVSGALFANEIRADRVDGETVSGNIEINALYAYEFDAETVSGDVEFGVCDETEIKVDSVSGSVCLIVSQDIGLNVDFSSISGDIRTDLSYIGENDAYRFGSDGARASIKTVSGNLYVK